MPHSDATRKHARALYGLGWSCAEIAGEIGAPERTIRYWRDTDGWAVTLPPEQALDARLAVLVQKSGKSQADWNELKRLNELRNGMLRRERREERAQQTDGKAAKGSRGKSRINEIGGIDPASVEGPALFAYQREFLADEARLRFYIKSRQIGFTYAASWDALRDAISTGRNQIFLSASKNQVGVFRDYVKALAKEHNGLDLKGSKERIDLHKDSKLWASFFFLSTNTATAQSYHGNVWIDEACWIPQYEQIAKVASGMAAQKRYRRTIFSTPSTVIHPAWAEFRRLAKEQPAGVSTRTLTIHDAIAGGCDLFDLEQLKVEYDEQAFALLFLCQPVDDELSIFKLAALEALQRDPADWKIPAGTAVSLGYDPSRSRDSASLQLCCKTGSGVWRAFHRESFTGKSYRWQASKIREHVERWNVQHLAIDTTGMGRAVFELVQEFFPRAKEIVYSLESKAELVQIVKHLVDERRLELPAGDPFLLHSFLAIKQASTQGGRITYKAGRSADLGHADAFFALAHALSTETIRGRKRRMVISG